MEKTKPKSRNLRTRLVTSRLIQADFDRHYVTFTFKNDTEDKTIVEELDLSIDHDLFRFSMFLESFFIKDLKKAREMLDIFIREEIEIGLMIDQNNEIIYSNSLEKDQEYEFKKHVLLDKLVGKKRITREMYEEMKELTYKEVKAVVK